MCIRDRTFGESNSITKKASIETEVVKTVTQVGSSKIDDSTLPTYFDGICDDKFRYNQSRRKEYTQNCLRIIDQLANIPDADRWVLISKRHSSILQSRGSHREKATNLLTKIQSETLLRTPSESKKSPRASDTNDNNRMSPQTAAETRDVIDEAEAKGIELQQSPQKSMATTMSTFCTTTSRVDQLKQRIATNFQSKSLKKLQTIKTIIVGHQSSTLTSFAESGSLTERATESARKTSHISRRLKRIPKADEQSNSMHIMNSSRDAATAITNKTLNNEDDSISQWRVNTEEGNLMDNPYGLLSAVTTMYYANSTERHHQHEDFERRETFYEEIFESVRQSEAEPKSQAAANPIFKTLIEASGGGGDPLQSLQEFKARFKKIQDDHRRCGPKCPHLNRFYDKIGWTHPRNRKTVFEVHKTIINKLPRIYKSIHLQQGSAHLKTFFPKRYTRPKYNIILVCLIANRCYQANGQSFIMHILKLSS
eukprot:TRINITY_DN12888_c0_g1_i4.p1 TRINITY_DN12888_c0_g1~~TRINITY_DN12888_c0_g1_i4.p1  ORF type:complete len:505 (+),score=68.01 TRINITY_DN12888_c0_g1_i4:70-1515(+)